MEIRNVFIRAGRMCGKMDSERFNGPKDFGLALPQFVVRRHLSPDRLELLLGRSGQIINSHGLTLCHT